MQTETDTAMVKKVIAGFVSLILGRKVTLRWGETAAMAKDGSIVLPMPASADASQIAALTRMAVHEAGHAAHTDLDCAQRLTEEQLQVFNLLEDPRIEMEQRKRFAGAGVILGRGLDEALDTILKGLDLQLEEHRAKALQLDIILRGFRAVAPQPAIEQRAKAFEDLAAQVVNQHQRQAIDAAIAELPKLTCSQDTEALAILLNRQLREQPPEQESQQQEAQSELEQEPEQEQPHDSGTDTFSDADAAPGQEQAGESEPSDDGTNPSDHATEEEAQASNEVTPTQDEAQTEVEGVESESAPQEEQKLSQGDRGSGDTGQDSSGQQQGDAGQGEANEQSDGSAQADATGASGPPDQGSEAGEQKAAQAGESASVGEPQGQTGGEQKLNAMPAEPTVPLASYDLGDMLREAYESKYGKPQPMRTPDAEPESSNDDLVQALREASERGGEDGPSLDELLEAALAALERAEVGEGGSQAKGVLGAMALAAPIPVTNELDVRLDGVQARMVRVLLRELQDRRRRPTKMARAGGQVAVNRFWRLGAMGDTKVFRVKARAHGVDAAVKVILDRSGSMRKKLRTAAEATLAFTLAMQRVGNVSTSVAMFPSETEITESLQSFGESPQHAMCRSKHLVAMGGTPLGAAVMTELPDLLRQRKEKHILVVVTDDGPDDPDLLGRALAEADDNGVEVIGVGIGCDIRAFIPSSTRIESIEQLPDALEALFRAKLSLRLAA